MIAHFCLIFILLFPQLRLVNILYDEILSRILLLIKAQLQYYNINSFLDLFCFLFLHCIALLFPHMHTTSTQEPLLTEIDSKLISGQLDHQHSRIADITSLILLFLCFIDDSLIPYDELSPEGLETAEPDESVDTYLSNTSKQTYDIDHNILHTPRKDKSIYEETVPSSAKDKKSRLSSLTPYLKRLQKRLSSSTSTTAATNTPDHYLPSPSSMAQAMGLMSKRNSNKYNYNNSSNVTLPPSSPVERPSWTASTASRSRSNSVTNKGSPSMSSFSKALWPLSAHDIPTTATTSSSSSSSIMTSQIDSTSSHYLRYDDVSKQRRELSTNGTRSRSASVTSRSRTSSSGIPPTLPPVTRSSRSDTDSQLQQSSRATSASNLNRSHSSSLHKSTLSPTTDTTAQVSVYDKRQISESHLTSTSTNSNSNDYYTTATTLLQPDLTPADDHLSRNITIRKPSKVRIMTPSISADIKENMAETNKK